MEVRKIVLHEWFKHPLCNMIVNEPETRNALIGFIAEKAGQGWELVFSDNTSTHFLFRKVEPFSVEFTAETL